MPKMWKLSLMNTKLNLISEALSGAIPQLSLLTLSLQRRVVIEPEHNRRLSFLLLSLGFEFYGFLYFKDNVWGQIFVYFLIMSNTSKSIPKFVPTLYYLSQEGSGSASVTLLTRSVLEPAYIICNSGLASLGL